MRISFYDLWLGNVDIFLSRKMELFLVFDDKVLYEIKKKKNEREIVTRFQNDKAWY